MVSKASTLAWQRGGRRVRGGPPVNRWAILALPAIILVGVSVFWPLGDMVFRSLTQFAAPRHHMLSNYGATLHSGIFLTVLGNTFKIAGLSTLIAALLGYPYAYLVYSSGKRTSILLLICVVLPLMSSALIRTFALTVMLQDTGVINHTLLAWGVISTPLPLIRDLFSVVVGMIQLLIPMMVLPIYAVMRQVEPELVTAAESLGASPRVAFWRVFFPLTLPGLFAGVVLTFVMGLGYYITPVLLGSPQQTMLSQLIAIEVGQLFDWGAATAMGVILIGATVGLLLVASRFVRLRDVFGNLSDV